MSHDFVRGQSVAETSFSHWGYTNVAWNPMYSFIGLISDLVANILKIV